MIIDLCKALKLPTVAREAERLANEAGRQEVTHLAYLEQLLELEMADRAERRAYRRMREAGFPLVKTMEGFDFTRNSNLSQAKLRTLATGDWIDAAESVILMGEPGTGKTHLATALGVAAAQQGRRVKFVTMGRLANDLVEAKSQHHLSRIIARYARIDLLIVDELGYVPLTTGDAELVFQVLSDRQERRALILTTNLTFKEWTSVFTDPRLCRAVIDRVTHRSTIIETGRRSIRLEEAEARRSKS